MAAPAVHKFKLSTLSGAEYNPRKIDDAAMKGLRESLQLYSLLEMPVVNVHGGKTVVVSGHQRIAALLAEGYEAADCVVVDYDPIKEKMANLTMNNPGIQGTYDPLKALPSLEKIVAEIPQPDTAGFEALMNKVRHDAERIGKNLAKTQATDEANAAPKVSKAKSKPGLIYRLGAHRLYSGSFQDGLTKLLGKKRPKAAVTDPPYRVAYEGTVETPKEGIKNDDLSDADWAEFLIAMTKTLISVVDGPCYVFMSDLERYSLHAAWLAQGGVVQRWLTWVKDHFTLNPLTAAAVDYKPQSEPCLYGWRAGLNPPAPQKARTNVLEYPRLRKTVLHPSQKPVELIRDLVMDATEPGDIVLDMFMGSGTTLVAAEELGRVCYGCELDLVHCDTIRQRWAQQVHGPEADWLALTKPA